jgi:hypothetical protein
MITRQEYKAGRRFIRDNGFAVIHWLSPRQISVFSDLRFIANEQDKLKERADVIAWCKREGISYNFRHLALV